MLPKTHTIFGFLFSIVIFLLFPSVGWLGFFLIWASSVLIDVDHYLYAVWRTGKIGIGKSYKWFFRYNDAYQKLSKKEQLASQQIPCIFHGIESTLILAFLSFFSPIFSYILFGFLFHQFLDFLAMSYSSFPMSGHLGSQIYNVATYDRKKEVRV